MLKISQDCSYKTKKLTKQLQRQFEYRLRWSWRVFDIREAVKVALSTAATGHFRASVVVSIFRKLKRFSLNQLRTSYP